mmetsp:Transcript_21354/g.50647  ORF Transcript_21354/g.50647 Transcript_21354/m.50647 type:complete len:359 (-) Transcript_21354:938-2014(-)
MKAASLPLLATSGLAPSRPSCDWLRQTTRSGHMRKPSGISGCAAIMKMKTTSPTTSTKRSCQPPEVSAFLETFITAPATSEPLSVLLILSCFSSLVVLRALVNMLDARPATLVCFFSRERDEGALFSPPAPPSDGSSGAPATPFSPSLTPGRPLQSARVERRSLARRERALSLSPPWAWSVPPPPPPLESRSPSASSSESSWFASLPSEAAVLPLAPSAWRIIAFTPLATTLFSLALLALCASSASLALFSSLAAILRSRSALARICFSCSRSIRTLSRLARPRWPRTMRCSSSTARVVLRPVRRARKPRLHACSRSMAAPKRISLARRTHELPIIDAIEAEWRNFHSERSRRILVLR